MKFDRVWTWIGGQDALDMGSLSLAVMSITESGT